MSGWQMQRKIAVTGGARCGRDLRLLQGSEAGEAASRQASSSPRCERGEVRVMKSEILAGNPSLQLNERGRRTKGAFVSFVLRLMYSRVSPRRTRPSSCATVALPIQILETRGRDRERSTSPVKIYDIWACNFGFFFDFVRLDFVRGAWNGGVGLGDEVGALC
ncbi:hypothetical protein PENSPDRAFT_351520 [Peniophora sp. CONT]|nr:hypothetical protein PENSPDRAFT_351520 [Peniophora sp. CONT]